MILPERDFEKTRIGSCWYKNSLVNTHEHSFSKVVVLFMMTENSEIFLTFSYSNSILSKSVNKNILWFDCKSKPDLLDLAPNKTKNIFKLNSIKMNAYDRRDHDITKQVSIKRWFAIGNRPYTLALGFWG